FSSPSPTPHPTSAIYTLSLHDALPILDRTLRAVDRQYTMQIRRDKELRLSLLLHLKPAINRHRYHMNVRNPMLEDIRQHYPLALDRKSTRLNSSHVSISYAVFCLKKKK